MQLDGLIEVARVPIGDGEVVTCDQGAGVIEAQGAGAVVEVLLV